MVFSDHNHRTDHCAWRLGNVPGCYRDRRGQQRTHVEARRGRRSQARPGFRKEGPFQTGMTMQQRMNDELDLLKTRYPDVEYRPDGQWARIPSYPLPPGWNFTETQLAFQIPPQYPGVHPMASTFRPASSSKASDQIITRNLRPHSPHLMALGGFSLGLLRTDCGTRVQSWVRGRTC